MRPTRTPRKCALQTVVVDPKVDRVGPQREILAVCLRLRLRDDALQLLVLGKELDALTDQSERPSSRSIYDRVAQELHELRSSVDERRIARRRDLRSCDLNCSRSVNQAVAIHEDRVGNDIDGRLLFSCTVTLNDTHRWATGRERLRAGTDTRRDAHPHP